MRREHRGRGVIGNRTARRLKGGVRMAGDRKDAGGGSGSGQETFRTRNGASPTGQASALKVLQRCVGLEGLAELDRTAVSNFVIVEPDTREMVRNVRRGQSTRDARSLSISERWTSWPSARAV